MDATLNLTSNTLAYGDVGISSNPSERYLDWSKQLTVLVSDPKSLPLTVAPGISQLVFDGTRSTSIANNTEFTLAMSALDSTRYRFTWDGTGTAPDFRTDRGLNLATTSVTISVLANSTATFTGATGIFASVQVGDVIFLPDVSTGDAPSPFNSLNVGYWVVLGRDVPGTILQLVRPSGQAFEAWGETVAVTAFTQVQAYSQAGVQVGDSVTISGGFSTAVQKTYQVVAINPQWFEVLSVSALPSATAVPTVAGIQFYTSAKRFLQVFAQQESTLLINGVSTIRLSPWAPGDPDQAAQFMLVGPCWSLQVTNLSPNPMSIAIFTAE